MAEGFHSQTAIKMDEEIKTAVKEIVNSKFQCINEFISKMDEKLDVKFTEMIEAIRSLAGGGAGPFGSGERSPPLAKATSDISDYADGVCLSVKPPPLTQIQQQPHGNFQSPFMITDDFVAIEVLQPSLHVHDLMIHEARMDDGVSYGVVAENGTDCLNLISCESVGIDVSEFLNMAQVLSNDSQDDISNMDDCISENRADQSFAEKSEDAGEREVRLCTSLDLVERRTGFPSSLLSCMEILAENEIKVSQSEVLRSFDGVCLQTVRRNAYETFSSFLPPAEPPDDFMNSVNRSRCILMNDNHQIEAVAGCVCGGERLFRTQHGIVFPSLKRKLTVLRIYPEIYAMELDVSVSLWRLEKPPWPPDATKFINVAASHSTQKREGTVFPKPLGAAPVGVLKVASNLPRTMFTAEDLNDRRAKGLCYFCDEKYSPGHYLTHKKGQLFMLVTVDDEPMVAASKVFDNEDILLEGAQVSINAVSGIDGYNPMRVKGMYGKIPLFILIYSSSIAARLGCTLSPLKSTWVAVADGNTLQASATIEDFELAFHKVCFKPDLMVIPLGNCDIVFGVQWLATLGIILWNFEHLTMEFNVNQRKLVLYGIKPGSVRENKAKQPRKLVSQKAHLAMIGATDIEVVLLKLLDFDYEIQYKECKENLVVDALSRLDESEMFNMTISSFDSELLALLPHCYDTIHALADIIHSLQNDLTAKTYYTCIVLQWLHSSSSGGHSGRDATFQRVQALFYGTGMSEDIQTFIRSCIMCQQRKYDTEGSPGLLQPLLIPSEVWTDVTMDFIEGLPPSFWKSVPFVVVANRLSKVAHFLDWSHPSSTMTVAPCYLDNVSTLHGFPKTIISDRDAVFTSEFWNEIFQLQGVTLILFFSLPRPPEIPTFFKEP